MMTGIFPKESFLYDSVLLAFSDVVYITDWFCWTGSVLCDPTSPSRCATRIRAKIVLFSLEVPITKGYPVSLLRVCCVCTGMLILPVFSLVGVLSVWSSLQQCIFLSVCAVVCISQSVCVCVCVGGGDACTHVHAGTSAHGWTTEDLFLLLLYVVCFTFLWQCTHVFACVCVHVCVCVSVCSSVCACVQ